MFGHLVHQLLVLFGKVMKSLEEEDLLKEVHLANLVFYLCFHNEDGIVTTQLPSPTTMPSSL